MEKPKNIPSIVSKPICLIVFSTLLSYILFNNWTLGLAFAELASWLLYMPAINTNSKKNKQINIITKTVLPILLGTGLVILNISNIKIVCYMIILNAVLAMSIKFAVTAQSWVWSVIFPIIPFLIVETGLGRFLETLKIIFPFSPDVFSSFLPVRLSYFISLAGIVVLINLLLLIFKQKKKIFLVFTVLSVILSLANVIAITITGNMFNISSIPVIKESISTINWSGVITSNLKTFIPIVLLTILSFVLTSLMMKTEKRMDGKEKIIRCILSLIILGIVFLLIASIASNVVEASLSQETCYLFKVIDFTSIPSLFTSFRIT